MPILTKNVAYQDGDVLLEGRMAWDDQVSGKRGTVLIAHAWAGRDSFVCQRAEMIARLGYVGFALDNYGKGVIGNSPEENISLMTPFLEDRYMLQRRLQSGLRAACAEELVDEHLVAAMGYCFGGLCVLDMARCNAGLCGVISLHGLLTPLPKLPDVELFAPEAKVLVLHGWDDPMVPPDQVVAFTKEMATCVDWQLHAYGQTVHSFTDPKADDAKTSCYSPVADARAWQTTIGFLNEVFG